MKSFLDATLRTWQVALLAAAAFVPPPGAAAEPQPLSADAARVLVSQARGPLLLDDVVAVDGAGAAILATHAAGIALDKVTTLAPPTAALLALHGRQPPAAAADARPQPEALENLLNRLGEMLAAEPFDGDAAHDLIDRFAAPAPAARRTAWLSLAGIERIDAELATALAMHAGPLALDGIKSLSVEAARALALHTGELSLAGLETLPADVGRALAQHRGPVAIAPALHRSSLHRANVPQSSLPLPATAPVGGQPR